MSHFHWRDDTLLLELHVQPGAAASGFAGLHGDRLKLRIAATAVDNRANEAVIGFLAGAFGVRRSDVTLVKGRTGRRKTFAIVAPRLLPAEAQINRH